jgi:general secretion pathway protein C
MLHAPSRSAGVEASPALALGALGLLALAVLWFLFARLSPEELDEKIALKNEIGSVGATPAVAPPSMPLHTNPPSLPAASLDGLVLRGISYAGSQDSSVILGSADGGDRVIRIGREIRLGARLKEVGPSFAVIATGAGDVRMELGRSGSTAVGGTAPGAAGGAAPTADQQSAYRQTVDYRFGLQPVKSNGRVDGFAIRPNAVLPQLQQAGLRPGDVIVAVNGQAFQSEEKVLELSNEIATSRTAEFEFIRAGKKMTASLLVR